MDSSGQDMRYCPKCGQDTDQQFSLIEETTTTYTLFWNCLTGGCSHEETKEYKKQV
jgi:hypothetical protein